MACNPPTLPGLVITTFVRKGVIAELITEQNVTPASTVVNNTVRQVQEVSPSTDLDAIESALFQDLALESPGISLITATATILFNALLDNRINVNFADALEDLLDDGMLELMGTEAIAEEVREAVEMLEDDRAFAIEEAATTGGLRGEVTDSAGVAIVGARVQVDGTDIFTTTDTSGRFSFVDLPEGATILNVDLPDFQTVSIATTVVALVTLDVAPIVLVPSVTFTIAGTFPVGERPVGLVVGDLNSDGNLDLATVNEGSLNISIFLGDGLGGFTTPMSIPLPAVPRSIAINHFNEDGNLDLATRVVPQ